MDDVNSALPPWQNAVNEREIVFTPLSKLVTRIINALDASDVSKQVVEDAKAIARKLQGRRASAKQPTVPDNPATPEDESSKSISASQMSFDNRIENFSKLIDLLKAQPTYIPNEVELQTATLDTLLTDMKNRNTDAINTYTPLSNFRIARNSILYAAVTGLVDDAGEVKKYIKSVYGGTSPQYKQVSKLKFTKVKT